MRRARKEDKRETGNLRKEPSLKREGGAQDKSIYKGMTQNSDPKNKGDIDREALSRCVKNSDIKKLSNKMEP